MNRTSFGGLAALASAVAVIVSLAGCGASNGSQSPTGPTPAIGASSSPATPSASAAPPGSEAPEAIFTPIPEASQAPDVGSGAAGGDIPDNAVFLTYHSAAWQFDIQYVEGWQVTTQADGVVIRDKDSSETVRVVQKPADVRAWVRDVDIPELQRQAGFTLVKQNLVKVGSTTVVHVLYHALSAPDSVTGKRVASTIDRFYLVGPALAVITLATPDGVDNVDAFRQIIGSFAWRAG